MTQRVIPLSAVTIADLKRLEKNGATAIVDGDKKILRVVEGRKTELTRKIMQVCSSCPHLKFTGGMQCDRKRSQCHSKRVRAWMKELQELEKAHDTTRNT